VVAKPDRVGEALEPDPVLAQPRHRQEPGDRAQRQQELVVTKLVDLVLVARQLHRAGGRVVPRHGTEPQIGSPEHVAQRRDHVPRLEGARRGLRQERRVQQEVDVVDEDQPRRLARDQALELPRRRRSAEPTTHDDHVPGHMSERTSL
jgi:hypothetical protein